MPLPNGKMEMRSTSAEFELGPGGPNIVLCHRLRVADSCTLPPQVPADRPW